MASTSSKIIEASKALGEEKGLSSEIIVQAITEAFQLAIGKKIEEEFKIDLRGSRRRVEKRKDGEPVEKLSGALVRVDCNLDKGKISIYHQLEVMNDEDITDDFLQISLEDAKEHNPKLKVGDFYEEPIDLASLSKKDVDRFISAFKQKIAKAEKDSLLEMFQDKIGNIMTGTVEKFDNRSVIVNLGRTSTTLYEHDLIGDEKFNTGDQIKVYIQGTGKGDKKSTTIKASRSCKEFLQKLFESEVNEINDGTVVIKDIARYAGKRSKVVVYSTDPNVDPSGACIGKDGDRIRRIVENLGTGNSKSLREKIDIILYHQNLGVYLAEILKPGEVIGINFSEDMKSAQVICANDTMKSAVGLSGINVSLAKKLTGLNDIRVYNDTDLEEVGITELVPIEKYIEEDEAANKEEARKRFREENIRLMEAKKDTEKVGISEDTSVISASKFEDEDDLDLEETVIETPIVEEEKPVEVKEEVIEKVTEEPVAKEELVVEAKPEPVVEIKEVKTTTTIESLEKSLEAEKQTKSDDKNKKSKKKAEKDAKKDKKEEKEEKKPVKKMEIYTQEELEEFEQEELQDEYDDYEDDYSEYDSDEFYED